MVLFVGITFAVLFGAKLMFNQPVQAERRQRKVRQDFSPDDFQPIQVVKGFAAIEDPPHESADVANRRLQPNELVLGVELEGVSRAYPINMLTGPTREIFNDTLGDRSIAATW